ncbi:ras guanine nucleotide exchange factor E-like [Ostrinia furnacalis]|uniref:ras guanine nucleotide exchange factor E-like n=1 Tax=Ostrinia furnacalis TaxID=93504 RepID=UPI00103D0F06|nr:ras guanine nucleotide exchange factor E-like [Ostrinia furnacalis]
MFNFIKKSTVLAGGDGGGCEERDGDKERRKREKKERKEREKRERIAAGLEEPLRLEEVRRSLKLRGRRKEKEKLPSGITADYTASLFAHLEQDSNYSNYPLIPTSGSNSNLSDENNHLSPGYPTTHSWTKKDSVLQSDSSETSLNSLNNPNNANNSPRQPPNLPPIPPRPPKRGILKGPRLSNTSSNSQESNAQSSDTVDYINGQDPNLLARNTQQNEVICYGIPPSKSTSSSDDIQQLQMFTKKVIHSPVDTQYKNYKNNANNPSIVTQDVDEIPKTNGNNYIGVTSTSPSADSLTDTTTNSSFATPPFSTSPVGESQGFHRWSRTSNFEDVYLPLPSLTPLQLPKPRMLTIQRQKSPRNDFGFSLRRAMVQERVFIGDIKDFNGHEENGLPNGDSKYNGNISNGLNSKLTYKAVILAEPGSYPGASETGLLPGDRLLEVNGVSVEGKSREDVIDLIKSSHDSVTIKVQPISELCELSRRRAADGGGDVELADSNVRGGTLSRSGSRRFTSTQSCTGDYMT